MQQYSTVFIYFLTIFLENYKKFSFLRSLRRKRLRQKALQADSYGVFTAGQAAQAQGQNFKKHHLT